MPDVWSLPRTLPCNTNTNTVPCAAKTSTTPHRRGYIGNGQQSSESRGLGSPTSSGYIASAYRPWLTATSAAVSSELAIDDCNDVDDEDKDYTDGDESDDGFFDDISFGPDTTEDEEEQDLERQTSSQPPSQANGKPDLRCWDHGCNGRVFATASNLARHQREKSNRRPSYLCPMCGAYFSRSTARNQHVDNKSCGRIRRYSNGRQRVRGPRTARKA